MSYCIHCGTQLADGVKFCTSCGTPPPQTVQHTPVQQAPLYATLPATALYQEEPIPTGSYIGILLLLLIPVVNLVCVILWACGGSRKRNKTNLARALLVWMLIGAVLTGLIILAGSLLFGDRIEAFKEFGSQISGEIVE